MANISETSINRPVLSTVMMLVILLFGFIGYRFLGVREFPSVDQPIISVNVSYPGANADVIMNQITEPLEQNINGIPGIRSLSSVRRRTMYVIRYLVPNATFPATATRLRYRKRMPMPPRSCRSPSEATNAR